MWNLTNTNTHTHTHTHTHIHTDIIVAAREHFLHDCLGVRGSAGGGNFFLLFVMVTGFIVV